MVLVPSKEICAQANPDSEISEQSIHDWWRQLNPNNMAYGLFNNRNCSSLVYRALRIGQLNPVLNSLPSQKTWWLDSPENVFNYASALAEKLLKNFVAELKETCEIGLRDNFPYMQATALYLKCRKYNDTEYVITLIKPLCVAIKNTLDIFHEALLKQAKTPGMQDLLDISSENVSCLNDLFNLAESDDNIDYDIETYFTKLRVTTDYIYKSCSPETVKVIGPLLQRAIKNHLLATMKTYLENNSIHTVTDQKSIEKIHQIMQKKIIDRNNPLQELVEPGSKVSLRPFSFVKI
jgi:hypothetical protein